MICTLPLLGDTHAVAEPLVFKPIAEKATGSALCTALPCPYRLPDTADRGAPGFAGPYGSASTFRADDLAVRIGRALEAAETHGTTGIALKPFSGTGPDELDDRMTQATSGYKRPLVDAGVLAQLPMNRRLVLGARVGGTRGEASAANPGLGALTLGNAGLTEMGLSADYALDSRWHARLVLRRTAFRYGSQSVTSFDYSGWQSPSGVASVQDQIVLGIAYSF